MEIRDIQRSKVVSDVLEIYKENEKDKEEKMKERKKEIDNIQKLRLWGREYQF